MGYQNFASLRTTAQHQLGLGKQEERAARTFRMLSEIALVPDPAGKSCMYLSDMMRHNVV